MIFRDQMQKEGESSGPYKLSVKYSYSFPHTSTCQVKVYVSNAVDGCIQCGKWQQYYSEHECLYVHSTCSKGSESKCLIGVWWPN